jgi:mono/diheme cytochrome c family protein
MTPNLMNVSMILAMTSIFPLRPMLSWNSTWRFTLKTVLCVLLLTLQIPSAYAAELPGDIAEGKRLHDANCKGCHDTSVYTRKDRQVGSLQTLKEQMNSCGHVANKNFSDAEKQSMIKYLNNEFYHFQ